MLRIPVGEGENVDKALKRFKRKFQNTGILKEIKERQAYIKPSEQRRMIKRRAIYRRQMQEKEE